MDERKLEELFRDTVRTVPPATFDENDVARRSREVAVRRRRVALGGTVAAAAVLAGGVGVGSQLIAPSGDHVASPPPAQQPAAPAPRADGGPTVLQERSAGCAPDAQLIRAVTAELPAAAGSRPSAPASCPAGARAAAFELHDGRAAGQVTVLVSPVGAVSPQQAAPGDVRLPDGAQQSVRKARSGKVVVVVSDPAPSSPAPPFGARVAPLAGDLAAKF
ncbi:hypothetical protein [Saccharopolyspora griseoalba]|uniref:Anti-sigma factor n=1 Tax=Saccharopolyspora griseoalba TaxID=1431848 RepID=A0ABW2LT23_9PSEU